MFKLKFKKLSKLLKNNRLVSQTVRENISAMAGIEVFLRENLPSELKDHCFPVKISNMTLTLMVDTPSMHSKLRFILPMIEETFKHHYAQKINAITIKVSPKKTILDAQAQPPKRRAVLSNNTRLHIQSIAEEMKESNLKDALMRLSKNRHIKNDV